MDFKDITTKRLLKTYYIWLKRTRYLRHYTGPYQATNKHDLGIARDVSPGHQVGVDTSRRGPVDSDHGNLLDERPPLRT